jgi:hypothetical protein
LQVLNPLRVLAATVGAIVVGAVRSVTGRHETPVELHPGDEAPDFALQGSDGSVHRLRDLAGRSTVVLAWFPKAFTGG